MKQLQQRHVIDMVRSQLSVQHPLDQHLIQRIDHVTTLRHLHPHPIIRL